MTPLLVGILGPTASGKTDLAEALASKLDAQLINADTFQAYVGMNIGTAKPDRPELYRLLNLYTPNQLAGTGHWLSCAQLELELAWQDQRSVVIVGGSGMNMRALFEEYADIYEQPPEGLREQLNAALASQGVEPLLKQLIELDPEAAAKVDTKNPVRVTRAIERALSSKSTKKVELPNFTRIKFAIVAESAYLAPRIVDRIEKMVHNGWVEEVKGLLAQGYLPEHPGFKAHGYRAMVRYIQGEISLEEAKESAARDTLAYTKRQRTWIKKEPNTQMLQFAPTEQLVAECLEKIRQLM